MSCGGLTVKCSKKDNSCFQEAAQDFSKLGSSCRKNKEFSAQWKTANVSCAIIVAVEGNCYEGVSPFCCKHGGFLKLKSFQWLVVVNSASCTVHSQHSLPSSPAGDVTQSQEKQEQIGSSLLYFYCFCCWRVLCILLPILVFITKFKRRLRECQGQASLFIINNEHVLKLCFALGEACL